jgi:hypothetical protein
MLFSKLHEKPYYDTYRHVDFPASFPGSARVLPLADQNQVFFYV